MARTAHLARSSLPPTQPCVGMRPEDSQGRGRRAILHMMHLWKLLLHACRTPPILHQSPAAHDCSRGKSQSPRPPKTNPRRTVEAVAAAVVVEVVADGGDQQRQAFLGRKRPAHRVAPDQLRARHSGGGNQAATRHRFSAVRRPRSGQTGTIRQVGPRFCCVLGRSCASSMCPTLVRATLREPSSRPCPCLSRRPQTLGRPSPHQGDAGSTCSLLPASPSSPKPSPGRRHAARAPRG